ncbi:hypothetical protein Aduo_009654 [Ancylostoma duodenale]
MNFSNSDTNAKAFYAVQVANSLVSTVCGASVHGYILYRILKKVSSLNQYQNLIILQSTVGLLSIISRLVLNQSVSLDGEDHLFFPFLDFHPILQKTTFFLVSTSESVEEFLIIIFNVHRVLIFLRSYWINKFYVGFVPFALAYAICYGVLMTKSSEKQLPESIMEILLVPLIVVVSMVCYALINRHFRRVSGYTEKVKQMQARLSTSLYLQGVIHSVLGIIVALVIPLHLLVAKMTDDEEIMFRFSLFYGLFILVIFRWYSAVTGALMLWSVRGLFQRQKVTCIQKKKPFEGRVSPQCRL